MDEDYRPKKTNNPEILQIDHFEIPIKTIGCVHNANEIIEYWHKLETDGFPLIHVSSLFVGSALIDYTKNQLVSPLPFPIHVIKMVDAVKCCISIEGGQERITNLKQQLCSLISTAKNYPDRASDNGLQVFKVIIATNDEFQIAYLLHKLYPSLKFNTKGGPDFLLENMNIKVEAKSKLNRTYVGDFNPKSIKLDKKICLRLLSRDAFKAGVITTAFDKQKPDIVIINLSHSEFGDIFAQYVVAVNEENYELNFAFDYAMKLVKQGKKAIILYTEIISLFHSYRIGAIASEREIVEQLGSELDKKEKECKIDVKTQDYYYLIIDEARKLE